MSVKRVAIIGAGPYGLPVLKYVLEQNTFDVVCFERKSKVGGQWNYEENKRNSDGTPTSSVYINLRLNSNKHVSQYPDFPHQDKTPHWPSHTAMAAYFKAYADNFNLWPHIKLNTEVTRITRESGDKTSYSIQTRTLSGEHTSDVFDIAVIANGLYNEPVIPDVPRRELFLGSVIHSSEYRRPKVYKDKRVLLVGAALSAWDIALDLNPHVKEIIVSHYSAPKLPMKLPEKGKSCLNLKSFTKSGVVSIEGVEHQVDDVIFCTGYKQSFPFLDESCPMKIEDGRISHLYNMIVHTQVPSLYFTGMYYYNSFVRLAAVQAKYVTSVICGTASLPPREDMEQEVEREFHEHMSSGESPKAFHLLGWKQESYCEKLAEYGKFEPEKRVYWRIMNEILNTIIVKQNLSGLRNIRFEPIDDVNFSTILP